jgi:hypothetical protein
VVCGGCLLWFVDYASRIVHPLARVLDDPSIVTAPPELKSAALDALCFLLRQLRGDFVIFVPLIKKVCVAEGGAGRCCAPLVAFTPLSPSCHGPCRLT